MLPSKLTIKGIKSFISEQTVDFDALVTGGVFGIFGDTGSGKSTIIDCLIFALYGKPAADGVKLEDFMNIKSSTAYVLFEFYAETDSGRKKFLIEHRLDRNAKGDIKHLAEMFDITGYIETGIKLNIAKDTSNVNAEVEKIVGLSLSDFRNCIILEQGKYDNFIRASAAERKKIIGNIFSLQRFGEGLAAKIKQKESDLNAEIKYLEGAMYEYGDITDGTLTEKQAVLNADTLAKEKNDGILESLIKEIDKQRKNAENYERKQRIRTELEEAIRSLNEFTALEAQTAAELKIKELEFEKKMTQNEKRIKEIAAATAVLEENKKTLVEMKELEKSLETSEQKKNALLKAVEDYANKINGNSVKVKELSVNLEIAVKKFGTYIDCEFNLDDIDNLSAEIRVRAAEFISQAAKFGELTSELNKQKESRLNLEKHLADTEIDLTAGKQSLADLRKLLAEAKEKEKRLKTEYEELRRQDALAEVVSGLKNGDQCPVCNNTISKLNEGNFKAEGLVRLKAAVELQNVEITELEKNEEILRNKGELTAAAYISLTEKKNQSDKKTIELNNALDALKFLKPDCVAMAGRVPDFEERIKQIISDIQAALKEERNLSGEYAVKRKELEMQTEIAANFKKLVNEKKQGFSAEASSLEDIENGFDKLKNELTTIENDKTLSNGLLALRASLTKLQMEKAAGEAGCKALKKQDAECGEIAFDSGKYYELCNQKTTYEGEKERLLKNIAVLSGECKSLSVRLESKKEILKKKNRLDKTMERLNKIKNMTGKNSLLEWVSEEYIEDFTAIASARLMELTGEMSLVYQKDGFYIVDNFNEGKLRKVATVSGGETFLVSVSLATAISQSLEQRAGSRKIEFMFIDEGFGTLSPNKLERVMDTLEALKKSDIIIGLISHVGEMRHILSSKIFVERPEITGSVIKTL